MWLWLLALQLCTNAWVAAATKAAGKSPPLGWST
jgi:hypothetical protein